MGHRCRTPENSAALPPETARGSDRSARPRPLQNNRSPTSTLGRYSPGMGFAGYPRRSTGKARLAYPAVSRPALTARPPPHRDRGGQAGRAPHLPLSAPNPVTERLPAEKSAFLPPAPSAYSTSIITGQWSDPNTLLSIRASLTRPMNRSDTRK